MNTEQTSDNIWRVSRNFKTIERFFKVLLGMISEKNDEKLLTYSHRAKDGVCTV